MTTYIDRIRKSGQEYTLRDVDALHDGDMMSRYAGRKVSIIGDSISTYNAAGYKIDGYNMYYPSGTVTDPALTWWMRVIHASGAALEVNASWAGSMATNRHSNPNYPDFYQRCGLLGSPELIFVQLGTNDYNQSAPLGDYDFETAYAELSEANFRTAYIKGVKALQANYPGAQIVLMVLYMGDGYAESIRHIGAVMGLTVIDVRGYVREQGSHPGAYGMRQISSAALNPMDAALELPGESADAAAVGAALAARDEAMSEALAGKVAVQQGSGNAGKALVVGADGNVTTGDAGIPDAVKVSLLDLVRHVAYIDDQGQAYYDALYATLYGGSGGYPRLQAVYAPGTHVVYTDDALDTLKPYLTVKRLESAGDSGTVVADYTLSGTLVDGRSTVLVRADGLVTAVQVEAVDFYNIHVRSVEAGSLSMVVGSCDPNQNNTTMYPSRLFLSEDYAPRRNFSVTRGKAPCYEYNQTAVPTAYYPIPIPADANKIRITMNPSGRYLYLHTVPYDVASGTYLNSIVENRVAWTQLTDGVLEKEITNPGNLFMILNSKYDSAGQSYPTDPTNLTIEFLEA